MISQVDTALMDPLQFCESQVADQTSTAVTVFLNNTEPFLLQLGPYFPFFCSSWQPVTYILDTCVFGDDSSCTSGWPLLASFSNTWGTEVISIFATEITEVGFHRLRLTVDNPAQGVFTGFVTIEVVGPNTAPVFEEEVEPFDDLIQYEDAVTLALPPILDAEQDETMLTIEVVEGDETGLFLTFNQEQGEVEVSATVAGDYVIDIILIDARNPDLRTSYQIDLFVEEGEPPLWEEEEEVEEEEEELDEESQLDDLA